MKLSLRKEEILRCIERESSLAASGTSGGSSYELLLATPEDGIALEGNWRSALNELYALLGEHIQSRTHSEDLSEYDPSELVEIEIGVSNHFNDLLEGSLQDSVKEYIANAMLAGWYASKDSATSELFSKREDGCALRIATLLNTNHPPSASCGLQPTPYEPIAIKPFEHERNKHTNRSC